MIRNHDLLIFVQNEHEAVLNKNLHRTKYCRVKQHKTKLLTNIDQIILSYAIQTLFSDLYILYSLCTAHMNTYIPN